MSENDFFDEMFSEDGETKIPVFDKRRFNEKGERIADDPEPAKDEPVKPQRERELEELLKAEPSAARPPSRSLSVCRRSSKRPRAAWKKKPPKCASV